MNIEIFSHNTLAIDYEKYAPWPVFHPIGSNRIGGLWRCHFLKHVLTAEDLSCSAWRTLIPHEILKLLQDFADCHAELIEMAQAVPEIFTRWARWNPGFTVLAATYWTYRSTKSIPDIQDRIEFWDNLDPRDILQYARCDPSISFLKALGKIPPEHCYDYVIARLRNQWQATEKKRLLRHLKTITAETTWLLECFPPLVDPGIHELANSSPYFEEFHIGHIISDLSTRREIIGLDPWPYRNRIHTWEQLLSAYDRFLRKHNVVPERYHTPPVPDFKSDEMHIEALKSRTALKGEAMQMRNCILSYEIQIYNGECYAYRLLKPERATVLVDRRSGRWSIAEAMLEANSRQVRSHTWNLLMDWVLGAQN